MANAPSRSAKAWSAGAALLISQFGAAARHSKPVQILD